MSSGFIFGGWPLRLTTPLIVPAVAGSMEIVAAFGAGCSAAGWDLLQPAMATNAATSRNPKHLKHRGTEEADGICLIFDVINIYEIYAFGLSIATRVV
jgi:hypothetical protein